MEVKITINKKDVMSEVYKITGNTGAKSENMDKISSSEDDINILESYFGEAVSGISDVISRQGYLSEETIESSSFCLTLPSNWNQNVRSSLEKGMKQYTVNYICAQWFNLSKKEDVKYYADICTNLAFAIRKYVLERKRPLRN